jgi:hypothetical protein
MTTHNQKEILHPQPEAILQHCNFAAQPKAILQTQFATADKPEIDFANAKPGNTHKKAISQTPMPTHTIPLHRCKDQKVS